jgi:hypothetical protein
MKSSHTLSLIEYRGLFYLRLAIFRLGRLRPFKLFFEGYYRFMTSLLVKAIARRPEVEAVFNTSSNFLPAVSDVDLLVVIDSNHGKPFWKSFRYLRRVCRYARFTMDLDLRVVQSCDFDRWMECKPELSRTRLRCIHGAWQVPGYPSEDGIYTRLLLFQSAMFFYVGFLSALYFSEKRNSALFEYNRLYKKILGTLSREMPDEPPDLQKDGSWFLSRCLFELERESGELLVLMGLKTEGVSFSVTAEDPPFDVRHLDAFLSDEQKGRWFFLLGEGLASSQIEEAVLDIVQSVEARTQRSTVVFGRRTFWAYLYFAQPTLRKALCGEKFRLDPGNSVLFQHHLRLFRRNLLEKQCFDSSHDFKDRAMEGLNKALDYFRMLEKVLPPVPRETRQGTNVRNAKGDRPAGADSLHQESRRAIEATLKLFNSLLQSPPFHREQP